MEVNVVILFFVGAALVASLILLRRRRRKRPGEGHGTGDFNDALARISLLRSQFPSATDQQACDRIERDVRAVGRNFSMSTSIGPKKVWDMAASLIREIAGIYYPNAGNPEMQATISDLLRLNERIVTRLNFKIREFPLSTVKDVNIHNILKGKDFYESNIKNKIEWFKKFEILYKIGNRVWLGYNALNPWYWGRKISYTLAREITLRYLLTWIVTIVGEEAMVVYGRRDINTGEAVFERDLAFVMVDMARGSDGISRKNYAVILDHVLNRARLSDTVRLDILRLLTLAEQGGQFLPQGNYTKKQVQRMLRNANRVAAADGTMGSEKLERLEALEKALEKVSNDAVPVAEF